MQVNPRKRRSTAVTSAVFTIVVANHIAHAQSAEAEALFNDGNKLMSEHKFAQACDAFEASNRIEPRAGTLIRLGECREQNQQLASAWSAFKDALIRAKDPRKRSIATAKIAALEPRLSYLTVSVSSESRVDGLAVLRAGKPLDPVLWNHELPVDGGDYIIVASAPGRRDWQTTSQVAVEGAKIRVEVPKLEELLRPVSVPVLAAATPVSATAEGGQATAPSTGMTTTRKVALGLAGVTVITTVAGAVFGNSARENETAAYQRCPDPARPCAQADQAQALIRSGQHRAVEANVAFGIAAAAAVSAGVLWFLNVPRSRDTRRVAVVPQLSTAESSISVAGRF